MKQSKLSVAMLALAVLSVSVLAVSPVSARHGADDTSVTTQTTTTSSDDSGTSNTSSGTSGRSKTTLAQSEVENETEVHHSTTTETEHVGQLKSEAAKELASLRKDKKEHTTAQRQKLCENRQTAVDNKTKAFGNAADKHLTRLNDVFTKLQAYQTEKNLPVTDYQALVDTAIAKQTAATTAVAALKTVSVNIDCTSTDPASSLTVVKTAAKDARTALKDYRKSLKAIVVALAQAKDSTSTDDTTTTTPTTTEGAN